MTGQHADAVNRTEATQEDSMEMVKQYLDDNPEMANSVALVLELLLMGKGVEPEIEPRTLWDRLTPEAQAQTVAGIRHLPDLVELFKQHIGPVLGELAALTA